MLKLTIFRERKGRRRPKIIQPALALANFGEQPRFVVINAFLRTKALERSPMPHQAELAMAVSAVIFHNLLSEWHLNRKADVGCRRCLLSEAPSTPFSQMGVGWTIIKDAPQFN
jgi:hypothetical protein